MDTKCPTHKKVLTHYCTIDRQMICRACLETHEPSHFEIIEISKGEKKISENIEAIIEVIEKLQVELEPVDLKHVENEILKGKAKLQDSRYKLLTYINNYFDELVNTYSKLFERVPNNVQKNEIGEALSQKKENLSNLNEKIGKSQHKLDDLISFLKEDYQEELEKTALKVKHLKEFQKSLEKQSSDLEKEIPTIVVKDNFLNSLFCNLTRYTWIDFNPLELREMTKFNLNMPNYFTTNDKVMALIKKEGKEILLHSVDQKGSASVDIKSPTDLPYGGSILTTPDSKIYYTGGVILSNKCIKNNCYSFDPEKQILSPITSMLIKRVGHSLLYLDANGGEIYAFGGRTDSHVRTKLCEKYNIMRNSWEKIPSMSVGRSRAAVCLFDERFIYAFFGTSSDLYTLDSIERFDLELCAWNIVEVCNILSKVSFSMGFAHQANEYQILLFGGFYDNVMEEEIDSIISNKTILMFNTNVNSMTIMEKEIAITVLNTTSSPPFSHDNILYCIGNTMASCDPKLVINETDTIVLRLGENLNSIKVLKSNSI